MNINNLPSNSEKIIITNVLNEQSIKVITSKTSTIYSSQDGKVLKKGNTLSKNLSLKP